MVDVDSLVHGPRLDPPEGFRSSDVMDRVWNRGSGSLTLAVRRQQRAHEKTGLGLT
jgi:hypothetical protein